MVVSREGIRIQLDGPVCLLTLDRPLRHNALDDRAMAALTQAIAGLTTDVRVLVLAGAGVSFCAGGERLSPGQSGPAERARRLSEWNGLCDLVAGFPGVAVAVLRGHCVGGGALLALSCDLRLGDHTVSVRVPEVCAGIPAHQLPLRRLQGELGLSASRDLLLTGRRWTAAEAAAAGFLQLVPALDLDREVSKLVASLVVASPERLFQDKADLSQHRPAVQPRAGHRRDGVQHG